MSTLRQRWEEQYASGVTPWDTGITPPEVVSFWSSGRLPAGGLALDIGSGPATNVLFLARQGLTAIGFDIALQALETGRRRIQAVAAELAARACLVQADITALPLHQAGASYILDVGCSHGLDPALRPRFVAGIVDNLRPGGYYHLYAFDRVAAMIDDPDRKLRGMEAEEIVERFTPALEVVEIVRAIPERYPCRWYLLRKPLEP